MKQSRQVLEFSRPWRGRDDQSEESSGVCAHDAAQGKPGMPARALCEQWRNVFKGTDMEDIPVILLDGGMKLEVVDRTEE